MKLSELTTAVNALSTQLSKVQGEILTKITDLETALTDLELPDDAVEAIESLRGKVQALDDIVPDTLSNPVVEG